MDGRKSYSTIAGMLNSGSGFGWNADTKRVTADDEVSDGYIKNHPNAAKYREQGCDYFEQLQIVVGNSIATGSFAQGVSIHGTDNPIGIEDVDIEGVNDEINNEDSNLSNSSTTTTTTSNGNNLRSTTAFPRFKRRASSQAKNNEDVANSLLEIVVELKIMNERKNSQQWLVALNEIPDLDPILKFMAPEFLKLHENKVAFITMTQEERRAWLAWKASRT
ncbi:hypothetical protein H6P81_006968 [Aristolochia fimbriata]|uniref:At2g29880-like C-terminal domain-containing protein n=1 Tax=Aristolochia fimbriata TaxID=158543 RepID=A0AAV7EZM7_ARIFI|nr:hypothetical protein H6P81_006968 [Aristolochia fimbriata]